MYCMLDICKLFGYRYLGHGNESYRFVSTALKFSLFTENFIICTNKALHHKFQLIHRNKNDVFTIMFTFVIDVY